MIPDFPTTRTEAYLAAILGGDGALPVPESRTDLYLAKIAGMDTEIPAEPQTRSEKYLAAILGADLVLPAPLSRKDLYLAKKAGMDVEIPEPLTRLEAYLAEWAGGSGTLKTVTGSLIHITDALASPVNALSVNIDPVQSGSGDPSPDNVRPISGHGEVNVWRSKEQLWDRANGLLGIYPNGAQMKVNASSNAFSLICPCEPNKTYTITKKATARLRGAYTKALPAHGVSIFGYAADDSNTKLSITTGEDAAYLIFYVWYKPSDGANWSYDFISSIVVEEGASSVSIVAVTIPTPPETVYGGTLDVLSGVLTVDRAAVSISDLSWTYSSTYGRMQTNGVKSVIKKAAGNDKRLNGLMCSAYTARSAVNTGTQAINGTIAVATTGDMYIRDEAYSDADAWKTAMGSQTIIYPLAEPQTYQLTPQQVSTLPGENNIWADTGDTTLTYMARG